MSETTFRSIIQFRKRTGSIYTHTRTDTHRQIQLPWCLYAFCMVLSHWWRVCHVLKGMVTQAASSLSSGVTRPLRSNNRDSRHQRRGSTENRLRQLLWHSFSSCRCSGMAKNHFYKDLRHMFEFHRISSIGVMGAIFMKHAGGPENLQPIGLYISARCCQA